MRTVDADWNEVANPDLEAGFIVEGVPMAKPGAYDTIDNVTKHALGEDDYEIVNVYRAYTDGEMAEWKRQASNVTIEDLMEAVAELGAIVAEMEG